MDEKLIECSDDILKMVAQDILRKNDDLLTPLSCDYPGGKTAFIRDRNNVVNMIKEQRYDKLPNYVFNKNPDLSRIEILNKLIESNIASHKKIEERRKQRRIEEEKKKKYFKEYPNQDYYEYGDFNPYFVDENKYYIKKPGKLFSEYESWEWDSRTFYYVYMHKNKKYVRFISDTLVDHNYDYIIKYWNKDCYSEIKELHKFGIMRNVSRMLVDENMEYDEICEDPYEALEYVNMFMHLGAKDLWLTRLTEDTECGFYYQ